MFEPVYPDGKRTTLYAEGLEFQDFVCATLARSGIILQNLGSKRYQIAIGENIQGFEIKYDGRFRDTGRLSIEIAEKSRASNVEWIASGIYRNDNTWLYIQGDWKEIYIFPKNRLQQHHRRDKPPESESHGTVRKFYIPLPLASLLAVKIIYPPIAGPRALIV